MAIEVVYLPFSEDTSCVSARLLAFKSVTCLRRSMIKRLRSVISIFWSWISFSSLAIVSLHFRSGDPSGESDGGGVWLWFSPIIWVVRSVGYFLRAKRKPRVPCISPSFNFVTAYLVDECPHNHELHPYVSASMTFGCRWVYSRDFAGPST